MTYINPADTRREYKRTQEAHQKPRPQPRGDTRRGDQPPPTKRSRAPDHARHDRGQNAQPSRTRTAGRPEADTEPHPIRITTPNR